MTKFCRFQTNGDATQLTSSMSLVSRKLLTKAETLSYQPVIFHRPVRISNQSCVNLLTTQLQVSIAWRSKIAVTEKTAASHVFPSIEQGQGQGQQQPEMESTRRPVSWISYCSNSNKISLETTSKIVEQRAILLCEEENLEGQMSGSNSEQQPSSGTE